MQACRSISRLYAERKRLGIQSKGTPVCVLGIRFFRSHNHEKLSGATDLPLLFFTKVCSKVSNKDISNPQRDPNFRTEQNPETRGTQFG